MRLGTTPPKNLLGLCLVGAMTLGIRGLCVTLSITVVCYYAECCILYTIVLDVVYLRQGTLAEGGGWMQLTSWFNNVLKCRCC